MPMSQHSLPQQNLVPMQLVPKQGGWGLQVPLSQKGLPSAQVFPHVPQFLMSFPLLTQSPSQHSNPIEQPGLQSWLLPPAPAWPLELELPPWPATPLELLAPPPELVLLSVPLLLLAPVLVLVVAPPLPRSVTESPPQANESKTTALAPIQ